MHFFFKKNKTDSVLARMICFPHAGGSASLFANWGKFLPPHLELMALQLPGRETRLNESLQQQALDVISIILPEIENYLDLPYVIYGHSMGALLAFELARAIEQYHLPTPKLCIISGRGAAHIPSLSSMYKAPEEKLIKWLRQFNETSEEVFASRELMKMIIPIMRADLAVTENYSYENFAKLNIPLVACGGDSDPSVPISALKAWRFHTNAAFYMEIFAGGHFFNFKNLEYFIKVISKYLTSSLKLD